VFKKKQAFHFLISLGSKHLLSLLGPVIKTRSDGYPGLTLLDKVLALDGTLTHLLSSFVVPFARLS